MFKGLSFSFQGFVSPRYFGSAFLNQLFQMIAVPPQFRLDPMTLQERPHAFHQSVSL